MILNRRVPAELRPALLIPAAGFDTYGDPKEDWASPTRLPMPPGSQVQERDATESEGTVKHFTRTDRVLYVPAAFPALTSNSRVEYLGESYRVDGPPKRRRSLTSSVYTTADLVRTEGA